MERKIRQGVFETNSSSTHSICIAKDATLEFPKALHFKFGEFGWEEDHLDSTQEKASYLYTGLANNERYDDINKVIDILRGKGIEVTKQEATSSSWSPEGYVDHSSELVGFLDSVMKDEDQLLSYLFSDFSFVLTGNDNNESDIEISVDYPHHEYFKGN